MKAGRSSTWGCCACFSRRSSICRSVLLEGRCVEDGGPLVEENAVENGPVAAHLDVLQQFIWTWYTNFFISTCPLGSSGIKLLARFLINSQESKVILQFTEFTSIRISHQHKRCTSLWAMRDCEMFPPLPELYLSHCRGRSRGRWTGPPRGRGKRLQGRKSAAFCQIKFARF